MTTSALLAIAAFLSLIGVRFIPRSGRLRHAWLLLCIVNLGVVGILYWNSVRKDQVIGKLQTDVTAVRDYSDVARRDARGCPPGAGIGSDIKFNDGLTDLLADMYSTQGNQIVMKRGLEAEERYKRIIAEFPKFPFAYYDLALCLRERHAPEWREYGQQAVQILTLTTQIDGHSANHDEVLAKVSAWLQHDPTKPDLLDTIYQRSLEKGNGK